MQQEVEELFEQVKDSSYRIMNTDDGVNLFNKKGVASCHRSF